MMKIAISGKGGVGKTTIASALVKLLAGNDNTVYAIDGDPDACLAAAIGIPAELTRDLRPVVEMRDKIRQDSGQGAFYTLNPKLDDKLDDYCYHHGNIMFMRMGNPKKGGSECYCRENTFLSALITSLLLDKNEVVVMDMGAGIEHLTRGTAKGVDMMLVIVEPSLNSINTARLVQNMAADLGIKRVKIIANKIRSPKEREFIANSFQGEDVLGYIEFQDSIWANALEPALTEESGGELLVAMEDVCRKIKEEVGN